MPDASRGFMTRLGPRFDAARRIDLTITVDGPGPYECHCFVLDGGERLLGERFMIWSGMDASPGREVTLSASGGTSAFGLELSRLPAEAVQLSFTCAAPAGSGMRRCRSFSAVLSQGGERISLRLSGADFGDERAVMAALLYKA